MDCSQSFANRIVTTQFLGAVYFMYTIYANLDSYLLPACSSHNQQADSTTFECQVAINMLFGNKKHQAFSACFFKIGAYSPCP